MWAGRKEGRNPPRLSVALGVLISFSDNPLSYTFHNGLLRAGRELAATQQTHDCSAPSSFFNIFVRPLCGTIRTVPQSLDGNCGESTPGRLRTVRMVTVWSRSADSAAQLGNQIQLF